MNINSEQVIKKEEAAIEAYFGQQEEDGVVLPSQPMSVRGGLLPFSSAFTGTTVSDYTSNSFTAASNTVEDGYFVFDTSVNQASVSQSEDLFGCSQTQLYEVAGNISLVPPTPYTQNVFIVPETPNVVNESMNISSSSLESSFTLTPRLSRIIQPTPMAFALPDTQPVALNLDSSMEVAETQPVKEESRRIVKSHQFLPSEVSLPLGKTEMDSLVELTDTKNTHITLFYSEEGMMESQAPGDELSIGEASTIDSKGDIQSQTLIPHKDHTPIGSPIFKKEINGHDSEKKRAVRGVGDLKNRHTVAKIETEERPAEIDENEGVNAAEFSEPNIDDGGGDDGLHVASQSDTERTTQPVALNGSGLERTPSVENYHTASNVTPAEVASPMGDDSSNTVLSVECNFLLNVKSVVSFCSQSNTVVSKKIIEIKECRPGLRSGSESSSVSSAGSVYSDKTGLPFQLNRMSAMSIQTQSSTSTNNSGDLPNPITNGASYVTNTIPWEGDGLVPVALDEALPRVVSECLSNKDKTLISKKTPVSRLSLACPAIIQKAQMEKPDVPPKSDTKLSSVSTITPVERPSGLETTPLQKSTPKRVRSRFSRSKGKGRPEAPECTPPISARKLSTELRNEPSAENKECRIAPPKRTHSQCENSVSANSSSVKNRSETPEKGMKIHGDTPRPRRSSKEALTELSQPSSEEVPKTAKENQKKKQRPSILEAVPEDAPIETPDKVSEEALTELSQPSSEEVPKPAKENQKKRRRPSTLEAVPEDIPLETSDNVNEEALKEVSQIPSQKVATPSKQSQKRGRRPSASEMTEEDPPSKKSDKVAAEILKKVSQSPLEEVPTPAKQIRKKGRRPSASEMTEEEPPSKIPVEVDTDALNKASQSASEECSEKTKPNQKKRRHSSAVPEDPPSETPDKVDAEALNKASHPPSEECPEAAKPKQKKRRRASAVPEDSPSEFSDNVELPVSSPKPSSAEPPQTPVSRVTPPSSLRKRGTPNKRASSKSSATSESDSTRKRRKSLLEEMTPGTPSTSGPPLSVLKVGLPVFARWSDRFYYSGILHSEQSGKWLVHFQDGTRKTISGHFIVPNYAIQQGHTIQVYRDDQYDFALILEKLDNDQVKVDVDNTEIIANMKDVRLTDNQFKTICGDMATLAGEFKDVGDDESQPKSSVNKKGPETLSQTSEMSSSDFDSDRTTLALLNKKSLSASKRRSLKLTPGRRIEEWELTPDLDIDETVSNSIKPNTKTIVGDTKSKTKRKIVLDSNDDRLGPLPAENSNIFKGMYFLLCYVRPRSKTPVKKMRRAASGSELSMSDSEDATHYDQYERFPFDEARLRQQLTLGGGVVCDKFSEVPPAQYRNTRLVSNRPNNSAKFILCLVHAIKVILHVHVIQACKGQNIRSLELPHSGWSVIERRWMERKWDVSMTFVGKQFYLFTKSQDAEADDLSKSFWQLILSRSGATIVEDISYADVIVTDPSLPKEVVSFINEIGDTAPIVVSTKWVVESLKHCYPVDHTLHPSFSYNFEEGTQSE